MHFDVVKNTFILLNILHTKSCSIYIFYIQCSFPLVDITIIYNFNIIFTCAAIIEI